MYLLKPVSVDRVELLFPIRPFFVDVGRAKCTSLTQRLLSQQIWVLKCGGANIFHGKGHLYFFSVENGILLLTVSKLDEMNKQ